MCGVGFICHIKGQGDHKIVSDARNILVNMTHRGASEYYGPSRQIEVYRVPDASQPVRTPAMVTVPVS